MRPRLGRLSAPDDLAARIARDLRAKLGQFPISVSVVDSYTPHPKPEDHVIFLGPMEDEPDLRQLNDRGGQSESGIVPATTGKTNDWGGQISTVMIDGVINDTSTALAFARRLFGFRFTPTPDSYARYAVRVTAHGWALGQVVRHVGYGFRRPLYLADGSPDLMSCRERWANGAR